MGSFVAEKVCLWLAAKRPEAVGFPKNRNQDSQILSHFLLCFKQMEKRFLLDNDGIAVAKILGGPKFRTGRKWGLE